MPTSPLTIHYTPVSNFIANSETKTTITIPVADFTQSFLIGEEGPTSIKLYKATFEVDINDDNLNEPNGNVTVYATQ